MEGGREGSEGGGGREGGRGDVTLSFINMFMKELFPEE